MSDELKPCPFCDRRDPPEVEASNYPGEFRIVCNANKHGCGGSSGYETGKDNAIKAWNQRH